MSAARMLARYAEIAGKVGLNLRACPRPVRAWCSSIEAVPLSRHVALDAYKAGARFVDVIWRDDHLGLLRPQHAQADSFGEFPD